MHSETDLNLLGLLDASRLMQNKILEEKGNRCLGRNNSLGERRKLYLNT